MRRSCTPAQAEYRVRPPNANFSWLVCRPSDFRSTRCVNPEVRWATNQPNEIGVGWPDSIFSLSRGTASSHSKQRSSALRHYNIREYGRNRASRSMVEGQRRGRGRRACEKLLAEIGRGPRSCQRSLATGTMTCGTLPSKRRPKFSRQSGEIKRPLQRQSNRPFVTSATQPETTSSAPFDG